MRWSPACGLGLNVAVVPKQPSAPPDAGSARDGRAALARGGSATPARSIPTMSVPHGYEPFSPSPFGELVGPLYAGWRDSGPTIAVRVGSEHGNRSGRAHGGLMMTLADIALTRAALEQLPPSA